jgi:hypothetical protein
MAGGGCVVILRLRGYQLNSSSATSVYHIAMFQNKKLCSYPNSSPLIFIIFCLVFFISIKLKLMHNYVTEFLRYNQCENVIFILT